MHAALIILHANVVTMDRPRLRAADAVAVADDGRIVAVGTDEEIEGLAGPGTRRFDAQGQTLLPGIVDPHLHLMAYAAHLRSLDLSGARSMADLQAMLRAAAATLPLGAWARGVGYDEWSLRERRHPTRQDLDAAVWDRPVRLLHRSGHASVLNSRGLEAVGIGMDSEEPPGGTIDREVPSGAPSGLLIDMEERLAARIPPFPPAELEAGVREASRRLVAWGVTAVEDASPNSEDDLQLLASYATGGSGPFRPALAAAVDARAAADLSDAGLVFGGALGALSVREAKIIVSASSGRVAPEEAELTALMERASAHGYPVAVHAVEAEALEAALDAFERTSPEVRRRAHRIEHASVCPPGLLERLGRGVVRRVVTQPAFLYWSGGRYRETVEPEERRWLYRVASFARLPGLLAAASSDAPVTAPDPRTGLYGAMARRGRGGGPPIGDDPPLAPEDALMLFTRNAAAMAGWGEERGRIAPGYRADLVLWDVDLSVIEDADAVLEARVLATFLGGERVFGG